VKQPEVLPLNLRLPAGFGFHPVRCLIPFKTGYHLDTYRWWFGNALRNFLLFFSKILALPFF